MNKKHLIVLAILLLAAVPLRAQWYLGGGLSYSHSKINSTHSLNIMPEAGYIFGNVAVGASISVLVYNYTYQDKETSYNLEISPYVQYFFWESGPLAFYVEGGVGLRRFISTMESYNQFTPYICPGIQITLSEHWCLDSYLGRLSYDTYSQIFSMGIDSGVGLGLFYNF